jgi:hypothetical protein
MVQLDSAQKFSIMRTLGWDSTVYGNVKEELPPGMPPVKGKAVHTSHYKDANLHHNLVTGHTMSGIHHLVKQTPIAFFARSNRQLKLQPMDLNS